ncbi:unnamed protein product, partial [Citrullus colocynthis]
KYPQEEGNFKGRQEHERSRMTQLMFKTCKLNKKNWKEIKEEVEIVEPPECTLNDLGIIYYG